MNKDVKKLWVDALNSGEYKQGFGTMNHQGCLCVLAVLCDLHNKHTNPGYTWESTTAFSTALSYKGEHCKLPDEVRDWAELFSNSPFVEYDNEDISLIKLNDNKALSFKKLAKIIDKQL